MIDWRSQFPILYLLQVLLPSAIRLIRLYDMMQN